MNIALFGFMGTGKTTVAKLVARLLRMDYISTDEAIIEREKRPISEIFEKDKEPYFREIEKEAVKEISELDNVVIDTGGGVVLNEENIVNLKKKGILILLKAREDVILERIKSDISRPLLNVDDKVVKIKELLKIRSPYYDKISITIDTSDKTPSDVAEDILNIYSEELKKKRDI